jgi:hypothetical protein
MARRARAISDLARRMGVRMQRWLTGPRLYEMSSRERVGVVYLVDSPMCVPNRLLLYSLVRTLRPAHMLEVGTFHGGTAAIIASAMQDNGTGVLVTMDPAPRIVAPERWFHGRVRVVREASPEGLPAARKEIGGARFGLVILDGPNIHDHVLKQLRALPEHVEDRAFVIVNNSYHYGVNAAIDQFLREHPQWTDSGFISDIIQTGSDMVAMFGLRLLRRAAPGTEGIQRQIDEAYRSDGKQPPRYSEELLNHDGWWCRTVEPCPICRRKAAAAPSGSP